MFYQSPDVSGKNNKTETEKMESERTVKEMKMLKAEKKRLKKEKLLKKLEKRENLKSAAAAASAKPVPKNIVRGGEELTASGRHYTVSFAVPGSILDNAQSPELRTYLAGQVKK